jgi:DNA-binding HxlR family transcriptional regulator
MRSYGQFCGVAHALDLVGERWALLVVRELVLGPKRFTDLAAGLPGIGTNILTARLRELEQAGVVERRVLPPPAGSTVYELTPYGRELEPVLLALGRWGVHSMTARRPNQALHSGWIGVALRAYVDQDAELSAAGTVELRLEDATLHVHLVRGAIAVEHGPAAAPELVVESGNEPLLAMLARLLPPEQAIETGLVGVDGDQRLLTALLEAIPFPAVTNGG